MTTIKYLKQLSLLLRGQLHTQADLRREYDRVASSVRALTPDNPANYGCKVYSQCDEDGIITNIFSRIGDEDRIFIEIGCGNGLENNTHALLLKGWRGVWIDADKKNIEYINNSLPASSKLIVKCELVTDKNVVDIIKSSLNILDTVKIDFLSIDIDGNDLYVLKAILKQIKPRVVCVEYNPKFPPPMMVAVRQGQNAWAGDDYHGASLCSFDCELQEAGYQLIACSLSGVNAFFVQKKDATRFSQSTVEDLYQPARHYLIKLESGHRASLRFLADSLAERPSKSSGT